MTRRISFGDYLPLIRTHLIAGTLAIAAIVVIGSVASSTVALYALMAFSIPYIGWLHVHRLMVSRISSDRDFIHLVYLLPNMAGKDRVVRKQGARLEFVRDRWLILYAGKRKVARLPLFTRTGESIVAELEGELLAAGGADPGDG